MVESEALRHGRIYRVAGGRVAVQFLSNPAHDGLPLRVELLVAPRGGDSYKTTVRPGEPFAIGPDTWTVTEVDNVGTYDYVVRLARVAEPPPGEPAPTE